MFDTQSTDSPTSLDTGYAPDDAKESNVPRDIIYDSSCENEEDSGFVPPWLETLIEHKYIRKINSSVCIYISAANGWVPLRSTAALRYIADMTGGESASVNYAIAAAPAVLVIKRRIWPIVMLGSTFTQGLCRYYFQRSSASNHVVFYAVGDKSKPLQFSSYCVIPTVRVRPVVQLPLDVSYYRIVDHTALRWLVDLFGDHSLTALWSLGDALADFGNKRMFVLYGPGGIGKSAIVKIFKEMVGQTHDLHNKFIVQNPQSYANNDVATNALLECASARMVFFSDFEVREGDELNMKTIKALTGDDMADGVSVSVTIIGTSNHLPRIKSVAAHVKPDRARRLVMVPTVTKRHMDDVSTIPIDSDSINQLAYLSMVVRISYDKPPLATSALLYSLFLNKIGEALQLICVDDKASRMECVSATMILCWHFGIDIDDMDNSLFRMGSDCTIYAWGKYYTARIKPKEGTNLSDVGQEQQPVQSTQGNYSIRQKHATVSTWNR